MEHRVPVPNGPEATILLREITLLTSGADPVSFVSAFDVESGRWNKLRVEEDHLVIPGGINTVLMRNPGVLSCPEFGEELENIYRQLPLPSYEPQVPPSELTTPEQKRLLVEKRVVLWEKVRNGC